MFRHRRLLLCLALLVPALAAFAAYRWVTGPTYRIWHAARHAEKLDKRHHSREEVHAFVGVPPGDYARKSKASPPQDDRLHAAFLYFTEGSLDVEEKADQAVHLSEVWQSDGASLHVSYDASYRVVCVVAMTSAEPWWQPLVAIFRSKRDPVGGRDGLQEGP